MFQRIKECICFEEYADDTIVMRNNKRLFGEKLPGFNKFKSNSLSLITFYEYDFYSNLVKLYPTLIKIFLNQNNLCRIV